MSEPAKHLAVLGHPVGHSRSPAMQNAALEALGLADEWHYEAIDVAPEDFEPRVKAMPGEGFAGANVTIPHKEAALRLADTASPEAEAIGAANTLSFRNGAIHADNTDAGGLLDALPDSPAGKCALVLGAGGAARAVVWALIHAGAEVDVWNRTSARAIELCSALGGAPVDSPDPGEYELIVNTTSVGLRGEDPFAGGLPLEEEGFSAEQVVVDLVYGDSPTNLVRTAREASAPTIGGIEILVRQGARSLRIWTDLDAPLDVMRSAAEGGLSR